MTSDRLALDLPTSEGRKVELTLMLVIYRSLPARSTQPSTFCGMVKWVLAVVTPIAREETASTVQQ